MTTTKRNLKEAIIKLKSENKTQTEIRKILNSSKDTIHYHFNPDYKIHKNEQKKIIRKRNKLILVEKLGGKCYICGYNKCVHALHFHHRDAKEKTFEISSNKFQDISKLLKEIEKCDLVCANCHAEIEFLEKK